LQMRRTPTFRNSTLSTGEYELAGDQSNTGAQVRVLQFRVSGFGSLGASGVDALREECTRNSGHIGRLWLQALVGITDWTPYVQLFHTAKEQFRALETSTLMQRQAVYYALLALAEHIASQTLGFGVQGGATVRSVFTDGDQRREVKTAGERALDVVSGWIASEPTSFPMLEFGSSGGLHSNAKANVRKVHGVRYRSQVYLIPDALRHHLQQAGLSFNEVISAWKDSGATDCDTKRKMKRVRWDGARNWVVALSYKSLGMTPDQGSQGTLDDQSADFSANE